MDEAAADNNIVLVTVATFPEAIEAHIYRNRLENEGIPSFIADENVVTNQPWHSIAYGGVKLRVRAQDQEKALALINEIRYDSPDTAPDDNPVINPSSCPVCESKRIKQKSITGTWPLIKSILFLFPVRTRKKMVCLKCGYRWRAEI
jgi:predicted Zn-ribbon and HTH transcriptional regulator